MDVEHIKQWLNEVEYDDAETKFEELLTRPVSKENLVEALVEVGIDEQTARQMFTSADPALRILHGLTNGYEKTQLIITDDSASVAPWNNSNEYNWQGYFEGGNTNLALILLVLCAKCCPLPENAWGEQLLFYANAKWQQDKFGVSYE